MRTKIFFTVAVVFLMCFIGWNGHAQKGRVAPSWEYRIIVDPSNEFSATYNVALAKGSRELNALGFQGWELVGPGTIGGKKVFYLKREK